MTLGIKNWDDISIRYSQKNNATEAIIKKVRAEDGIKKGYLESCGASSFCTLMEGMEFLNINNYFRFSTGEKIQMDDAVMMYLNDPKNDHLFQSGTAFDNRYYKNYSVLAEKLFGVSAVYEEEFKWEVVSKRLMAGHGVQICLKDPGHYLALIAYDDSKNEIVYHDSWGTRPGLKNAGKFERLTVSDIPNIKQLNTTFYRK